MTKDKEELTNTDAKPEEKKMTRLTNNIHLTDEQYLDLLKRIRQDLDTIKEIEAVDCTDIGNKHTQVNVGLCAGVLTPNGWYKDKYTTIETAMWPSDFRTVGKSKHMYPQQFAMKYRKHNHKCPLDKRKKGDYSIGCFYSCLAFKEKNLTIEAVKKLYDRTIAERSNNDRQV